MFKPYSIKLSLKSVYRLTTIGLLVSVAGLSGCNSSSNAQSKESVQSASDKWTGEWQLKDPAGSGGSIKIILTNKEKVYVIPPVGNSQEKVAYDMPFEKVSDNTSLPPNIKVVALADIAKNQAKKARQSEGKTYIGTMNRAHQAYFLENNKFATTIEELQIGIKSETENYIYKIVPESNQSKSVMNVAQAKREGLKSYTGLVYVTEDNNGEKITNVKLCETNQALSKPPKMPTIPNKSSEKIKCPSDFKALN